MNRFFGIALIVLGIGLLGNWVDRSFFHPTRADSQRMSAIADTGSDPGDNRKLFLFGGVASIAAGTALWKKRSSIA